MAGLRAVLLLPLLLLGCADAGGEDAAALIDHTLATTRASLAAAGTAPATERPPAANLPPAGAALRPAVLPQPRLRGTGGATSAAALLGARAEEMRRVLGEPALRRPEGEAEIWLYEATGCRLDVVLYGEHGTLVVAHAAARAVEGATVTEAACLAAIAGAAGGEQRI